jgi:hypothetical protein
LLTFSGYKGKNGHQLNWTTATEQNTSYFEVQYSANGTEFATIGNVRAAGNSTTPMYYDFTNKISSMSSPFGGQRGFYYRLN